MPAGDAGAYSRPLPGGGAGAQFDEAAFRRFMTVRRGLELVTAERNLERLEYATRSRKFDIARFSSSAAAALDVGEIYLEARLLEGKIHAYNNDAKLLNLLARFLKFDNVRFPCRREPRRQPRALTPDQLRALTAYDHADEPTRRFRRALLNVALLTGLRVSEIATLELEDLDQDLSRIHVRRPAKRGLQRWLFMPRWIWSPKRPLGAYLATHRPAADDPRALWTASPWYNRQTPPRRVGCNSLRQVMFRIGQDLGFPLNYNITRHTCATALRKRDVPLDHIKIFLGHKSITSTEIYAEIGPEDLEAILRRSPAPDFYRDGGDP